MQAFVYEDGEFEVNPFSSLQRIEFSGGAKGGGGSRGTCPGCKTLCPGCALQLSYSDVDHLNESVGSEQDIILKTSTIAINTTLNSFLVNMADIRLLFNTRNLAVAERPHDACH